MANCKHCGDSAGLFRSSHKECETKHARGTEEILSHAIWSIKNQETFEITRTKLSKIAEDCRVKRGENDEVLALAWEKVLNDFLRDGILSEEEEQRLWYFSDFFALDKGLLNKNGALLKAAKAGTIRDLHAGQVSCRIKAPNHGFNFQKNEDVIVFQDDVRYLEEKIIRNRSMVNQGVSIRIAKGVYYKTGEFKSKVAANLERIDHGLGLMAVTTKHIYYDGAKTFRIPHSKIISMESYADGISVLKDTANAMDQFFVNGDGWFLSNIMSGLKNI